LLLCKPSFQFQQLPETSNNMPPFFFSHSWTPIKLCKLFGSAGDGSLLFTMKVKFKSEKLGGITDKFPQVYLHFSYWVKLTLCVHRCWPIFTKVVFRSPFRGLQCFTLLLSWRRRIKYFPSWSIDKKKHSIVASGMFEIYMTLHRCESPLFFSLSEGGNA